MSSMTTFRSAPAHDGRVPEVPVTRPATRPTPGLRNGGKPGRCARLWPHLRSLLSPGPPRHEVQHAGLERLLALLGAARAELSAGWVQDGWWAAQSGSGRPILATGLAAGPSAPGPVSAVCLVGALIRAGSAQGGDSEAGRAIDTVYDALWESRGQPAAPAGPGLPRVSSPQVRQAKVQGLTRWNDAHGRTRDEVLAVVDRAISRVIQDLAALPAPPMAAAVPGWHG
jgi:hypothetical protein